MRQKAKTLYQQALSLIANLHHNEWAKKKHEEFRNALARTFSGRRTQNPQTSRSLGVEKLEGRRLLANDLVNRSIDEEATTQTLTFASDDYAEMKAARAEKREPKYRRR